MKNVLEREKSSSYRDNGGEQGVDALQESHVRIDTTLEQIHDKEQFQQNPNGKIDGDDNELATVI